MCVYERIQFVGKCSVKNNVYIFDLFFVFVINKVYFYGSQQFKDIWFSVLFVVGCKMVIKILSCVDYLCDVVVCEDDKIFRSIIYVVSFFGIFIVFLEWFLQLFINGCQVLFDGYVKYDYCYKSE